MPDTSLELINLPEGLDESLVRYAERSAGLDQDQLDSARSVTFHAEFITWKDEPNRWAGAWAEVSVLAILEDYSQMYPAPKPSEIRDLEMRFSEETSTYNLPYKYREKYNKTVIMRGKKCSRTRLTHADIQELKATMSEEDQVSWRAAIENSIGALNFDKGTCPTFEKPVRVYMMGTDDTSYSHTYATREDAILSLNALKASPRWDTLEREGFIFSN